MRGIKMAVKVPVAAYLGVVIRMEPPAEDTLGTISIVLEHRDSARHYRCGELSGVTPASAVGASR